MSIQIAQCKFGLFCVLSVFSCCLQANASDLYFSAQEDANKYWDYAAGWKALSGTPGVLPTADDTITLNSKFLSIVGGGRGRQGRQGRRRGRGERVGQGGDGPQRQELFPRRRARSPSTCADLN